MNRPAIIERLRIVLEETTGNRMTFPSSMDIASFFDDVEYNRFRDLTVDEFDLDGGALIDTASTFFELVVLLEGEIS